MPKFFLPVITICAVGLSNGMT
uniref:Uncharacterized protein n=1 Tax=Anguilla anguilla TaxID=7936 RepID=A0A0E9QR26_ANGAN